MNARFIYRCLQNRLGEAQTKIIYRLRYGYDAPPIQSIIYANPQNIEFFTYPAFYQESRSPRIKGGNWDKEADCEDIRSYNRSEGRSLFSIQSYDLYQSMRDHFLRGEDWSDTEFYSVAVTKIREKESYWHGCTTVDDIENRFLYIDELYERIKKEGYKSASQDLNQQAKDEVTVNITRNGDIVMDDGRHRLFIAKILDIPKIPVWVLVRHKKWQRKRIEMLTEDGGQPIREHPDVEPFR